MANHSKRRAVKTAVNLTKCAALAAVMGTAMVAQAQPDYAPAIWRQAYAGHWYTSGNGHSFCVIHDMEGYYLSTISFIQGGGGTDKVSVYYCVNGVKDNSSDAPAGEITQMVREANYAWHAGCWNTYMYGTEHEGFANNPAWYTEAMYQASAGLQKHLCATTGIPKDRNHIIAHGEGQNASWRSWMAANWPGINSSCNSHTDPGPYWDWNHFMNLINGTSIVVPPTTFQVQVMGDFDGDGKMDIAWRKSAWGEWIIDYGSGAVNQHAMTDGRTDFNPHDGAQVVLVGDFDHDGKSDIAWRKTGWTEWIIDYGNGAVNGHALTDGRSDFDPSGGAQVTLVGDFDHDGKSDLAWRKAGWTEWIISYGNGAVNGHALTDGRTDFNPTGGAQVTLTGDFDGDGKSDIAWRKTGWGEWIIGYGNGTANQHALTDGRTDFNPTGTGQVTLVGDFDFDGKSDLAWRKTGWTEWIIGFGNGAVNGHAMNDGRSDFTGDRGVQMTLVGDFDGDGKSDFAWRKTGWTEWIIRYGSGVVNGHALTDGRSDFNPANSAQVAFAGDINNFNADKRHDIAWRKTGWGNWIVGYSSGTGSSLNDTRTDFDPALH